MLKSWKILENHPVNQRRAKRCQGTANSVWPWGQGRPPKIPTLKERFGIEGSVVAAVDLIRGIGKYAGLDIIDVVGATGYLDTNYEGKVEAALKSLENRDFVYLHVEAPDEAGHSGQKDLKIKAIEDFDNRILGPILTGLEKFAEWRILLMPDHCTPVNLRTHTSDPVPYVLLDSANWKADATTNLKFSETTAKSHNSEVQSGQLLINRLLNRESA
jgi:2,3-bisphosphoglycerate-independent phosphoglycerate mutase